MMAEDERSRRTPMREKVLPVLAAGAAGPVTLVVNMELEPGEHKIAVGVRDEVSRVASFHRASVDVRP